jgi:hypothetical protein
MHFIASISLALLASTSLALPRPEVHDHGVADISVRTLPSNFYRLAQQAIQQYGPGVTKTMMHSGIGPRNAFKVAKQLNLQIVETTILTAINKDKKTYKGLKAYCKKQDDFCNHSGRDGDEWVEAWNEISKAWAEYAQQKTTLAIKEGQPPAATSFYERVEKKVLTDNGVQITVVQVKTE